MTDPPPPIPIPNREQPGGPQPINDPPSPRASERAADDRGHEAEHNYQSCVANDPSVSHGGTSVKFSP
jgi:hypothetical protein